MIEQAWQPWLAQAGETVHERLIAAISEDISRGVIQPGGRLPAHRELAKALGISVATVTKAYSALQRSGLARSEAGRGMFACALTGEDLPEVDFSINMPPAGIAPRVMQQIGEHIALEVGRGLLSRYQPAAGTPEQRGALARLIRESRGLDAAAANTLLTASAQHALFIAFSAVPDGPIGVEALTYPGGLRILRQLGRQLVPLAMDEEGVTPASLVAAMRSATPPRVISLVPALQNPTGATMGLERRKEIARIARDEGLIIIEDDIYAVFVPRELPAFAELLPEQTLHVSSLSKCAAPGLRVGYLKVPDAFVDACSGWLEATSSMNNPAAGLALEFLAENQLFETIATAVKDEVAKRSRLTDEILGDLLEPAEYPSLHRWTKMSTDEVRKSLNAALMAGIKLASPEVFMAEPDADDAGVRICLGNPPAHRLRDALLALRPILAGETPRDYTTTATI